MCIGIQISEWILVFSSLGCIPRSRTVGLYGNSKFNISATYFSQQLPQHFVFSLSWYCPSKNKGSFWWGIFYLFYVWLLMLLVWYLRSHCLHNLKSRVIHILKSFIVVVFTFRPMIYFELIFVCNVKLRSNPILLHIGIKLSQYYCWKDFFSLATIMKSQLTVNVKIIFRLSVLFFHMYVSLCLWL